MNPLTMFEQIPPYVLVSITVWSLLWKGVALWRAAKYEQTPWFVAVLVINTLGILELTYLFFFCKKRFTFQELNVFK